MRTPLITLAAALALATPLAAQTGFDDLPASSGNPIPSGYFGFTWTNFYVLDGCTYYPVSGYCPGTLSASNVAVNWLGAPASISRPGDPFYFDGGHFTAGWNNDLNITVTGYLGEQLLFTSSFTVNQGSPYEFDAEWDGIDRIVFASSGGYDANDGDGGSGTQFALDNLDLNGTDDSPPRVGLQELPPGAVTPEPATMTLLATGLVGMAGVARRRRRKTA